MVLFPLTVSVATVASLSDFPTAMDLLTIGTMTIVCHSHGHHTDIPTTGQTLRRLQEDVR